MRLADRFLEIFGRQHSKRSTCLDCEEGTREGKEYCIDHLEALPYVQTLMDRLNDIDAEREKVRDKGHEAVPVRGAMDLNKNLYSKDGFITEEILGHLRLHGARTVERIAREINEEAAIISKYVTALMLAHKVRLRVSDRGSTIVTLIRKSDGIERVAS